jgi:hypothetical protein
MSTQTDFTPEEWKLIATAPIMAGTIATLSDMSGPVGFVKEALAVARAAAGSAQADSSELIRSVADSLKSQQAKPEMTSSVKSGFEARTALIGACRRAVDTISRKSPAEAAEYARWLVSLAKTATEASKEGGFLGIGGTLVSQAEATAITELASALGVAGPTASPAPGPRPGATT